MKFSALLTAVLIASGSILVTGCVSSGHERSAGGMMSDGAITTKVKTALLTEKNVNFMDIKVETFNGTVQLSGFVNSQWQIDKAVAIASGINGVKQVKNDLVHKPQ